VLDDWNWYLPKWLEWIPHIGGETGPPPPPPAGPTRREAPVPQSPR